MNGHAESMISLSTALLLFISACFFALGLTGEANRALQEAGEIANGQMRSIHQTLVTTGEDMFSGDQVIFTVLDNTDPQIVIEVEGTIFTGGTSQENIDWSMVDPEAEYEAVYQWGDSGRLERIRFTKAQLHMKAGQP